MPSGCSLFSRASLFYFEKIGALRIIALSPGGDVVSAVNYVHEGIRTKIEIGGAQELHGAPAGYFTMSDSLSGTCANEIVALLRKLRGQCRRALEEGLDTRRTLDSVRGIYFVAGEFLAGMHEELERPARAQRRIRRAWTAVATDPAHPACVRRLQREFDVLVETLLGYY